MYKIILTLLPDDVIVNVDVEEDEIPVILEIRIEDSTRQVILDVWISRSAKNQAS
jgi:hypothetical protein